MLSPSVSDLPRCAPGRRTRTKQLSMRRSDIGSRSALVQLLSDQNTERPRWSKFWKGLSFVWSRLESRPAVVFVLLSFAFGSAISVVVPPLRGPDEIAHFLRIYSYTRGGLLPAAEVDGRKGIFIANGPRFTGFRLSPRAASATDRSRTISIPMVRAPCGSRAYWSRALPTPFPFALTIRHHADSQAIS
jgi:hypothetical protein